MTRGIFARLSIRHKLVLMIMATSTVVLVLASVGYIASDYYESREDLRRELDSHASLIGANTTAAMAFRDPAAATETLQTLMPNTHILSACLYDRDGSVFARYLSARSASGCPSSPAADGAVFLPGLLQVVSPVMLKGQRRGTLLLRSDLELLQARLRVQLMTVGLLLMLAIGVALFMSSRLQSFVSTPISALARTASEVSSRGDYSIRATRTTEDELGVLVDAFNRMLERIQMREGELSNANDDLRREVVERRRAEEERAELLVREREASRLKDEFLATLSHELRTPLNAILGWTRLLRTSAVPPADVDRALEKVERNARVQSRLVEDLLEVSRIASGKLRLDIKPLDLVVLLNTALESIRPAAEARGVTFDRDIPVASLPTAGDPDRLQQVIWNLLSNAVKFTPPGGRVTLRLRRDGRTDELTISDTGIGIDSEFLPNVFETFRQGDASTTRMYGGLGLGLSIVRNLVEMHGGEVKAASEGTGKGARFTVRLPVRTAGAGAGPLPELRTGEHAFHGMLPGVRVLLVDDDVDTLELLQWVFGASGATVTAAASAAAALEVCVAERPAVLVTDIAMPGQDGYSLIRNLQAALGDGMPRVKIALTAFAGPRDRERSAAAGFDRHLSKPVDPESLVRIVRDLLAERGSPAI
jgi:signal transduction histidine kinase/ActR/RegA family two-component response regulator